MIAVSVGTNITLYAAADGSKAGQIPDLGAPVADIAISPDGRLLAAAQGDQIVSLWDIAERSALRELRLPQSDGDMIVPGTFTSVAFSPDSQAVVAGDDGGNVPVWSIADGVALQTLSVGLRIVADVAFSPDGKSVAAASEGWRSEPGAIWLWDVASGAELHRLTIDTDARFLAPAERIAFAPDGAQVLMGLADGGILRWNLADLSMAQELGGHSAAITALAYAPGGNRILSASRDGSLRTWRADGAPAEAVVSLGAISALAISPDGSLVISGDEGGAIEIRRPDGSPVTHIPGQGGQIYALAISPDGATLAAASRDGVVRLRKLPGGELAHELRGHDGPALAVAFSPDGERLASSGGDGTLRLWRVAGGTEERAANIIADGINNTSVYDVAFSPDGNIIAAASSEGQVSLWRSADLTLIERRVVSADLLALQATFTPEGAVIARDSGGQLYTLPGQGAPPVPILSPGVIAATIADARLITISGDALQVWQGRPDALTRYAEAAAPGFSSLAAGPSTGAIVIGSRRGAVEVWSVR
jgi:WD40 repeat protein